MRQNFTAWVLHCTHHEAEKQSFSGGRRVSVRDRSGAVKRMRHGAGRGTAVGAGGAFAGRAGPGATSPAVEAAAARLRRGQLRGKFSGVERGGRRLSGGLRPVAGRRGAGGDAGPCGAQRGSGAQVSVSVSRRREDRASAAGVGAGAGELYPGRERAVAGFGAGQRRGGEGIGPALRGAEVATVDLDATVIESWKREAKFTYEGCTGYQPVLALWAELNVVVADEFRDGNVPANQELLPIAQRAFQALPETVREFYFRGDSACHEQSLMEWLREERRTQGPPGFIGFAVSARMNPALHAEIVATAESRWQPYSED